MTRAPSQLLSDLVHAAENIAEVGSGERAGLLDMAASTMLEYRSELPASWVAEYSNTEADVVSTWRHMASLIDTHSDREVADALRHAAETLAVTRRILDRRQKRTRQPPSRLEDMEPEGSA